MYLSSSSRIGSMISASAPGRLAVKWLQLPDTLSSVCRTIMVPICHKSIQGICSQRR